MLDKKFHFINSVWKNLFVVRDFVVTTLLIFAIVFVSRLLMLVDVEDVIILNIFLIFVIIFSLLKNIVTKAIYSNKLYLIALFYVNIYLQEKIILTIYAQLLKNKLVLTSVNELSSNWLLYLLEELNSLCVYNSIYLDYLNVLYLNNLLGELNNEFIEKVEKIVDDVFILTQLNYYSNYLIGLGVLEDGTSKIQTDNEDFSESENFEFDELR